MGQHLEILRCQKFKHNPGILLFYDVSSYVGLTTPSHHQAAQLTSIPIRWKYGSPPSCNQFIKLKFISNCWEHVAWLLTKMLLMQVHDWEDDFTWRCWKHWTKGGHYKQAAAVNTRAQLSWPGKTLKDERKGKKEQIFKVTTLCCLCRRRGMASKSIHLWRWDTLNVPGIFYHNLEIEQDLEDFWI